MCTKCYTALYQFNELREVWAANQEKFSIRIKEEAFHEREPLFVTEEQEFEEEIVVDNAAMQFTPSNEVETFNCSEEYIEDFDLGDETHDTSEPTQNVNPNASNQRSRRNKIKPELGKDKGKAIYQQLLKECGVCGKMIEKNRMDGHMNKHQDIRPYECNTEGCGKTFYCKLLLRLHQKSMHSSESVACRFCSKTFPSERSLYSHELRHKNTNRYECELCNRKFNNGNSLKRHQAIHSGIREFDCEFCSASFYRRFNLGEFNALGTLFSYAR
jgi:uncharacterized Zn-finger protein